MVPEPVFSNSKRKNTRLVIQLMLIVGAVVVASQMSSCASPAYYWQAASGHFALMHARQPVDEALEHGTVDEFTAEKLQLSRQIIAFAIDQLGLPDNGSYTEFVVTGQDAVVWNVVAAPEFSLQAKQWCFPVSGCVPYRGYFAEDKAGAFADKLEKREYEVTVSPAIAYSTLGWFDDPLLDTMWSRSDARFAAYIIHELAHQQLYLKGDSRFNESYASFVELVGVQQWLRSLEDQVALQQWLELEEAEGDFTELMQVTRNELEEVYASGEEPDELRARKLTVFERMEDSYGRIRDSKWDGRDYFGGWFLKPPNNARFALLDTYQGGNCAFRQLFVEAGEDMKVFHGLASEKSRLPDGERQAWLDQTCAGIAPGEEL